MVVSVFYNRADMVASTVQCLLDQSHPDLRILLVDDGSTDDTLHAMRDFAQDKRVEIQTGKNVGFVQAISRALAGRPEEYIAIHGSGDVSLRRRIEAQVALATSRPDVDVVGCWVRHINEEGSLRRVDRHTIAEDLTGQLMSRNVFSHGEMLFSRRAFERVGGYRTFFTFAQDRDLWLRLSEVTGFAIVEEELYQRVRRREGVSGDLRKTVLQAYLSAFAVQCAETRRRDGYDPLDRYGAIAAATRQPSRRLARVLSFYAERGHLEGHAQDALTVARAAYGEWRTPRTVTVYRGLQLAARSPKIAHAVRAFSRRRMAPVLPVQPTPTQAAPESVPESVPDPTPQPNQERTRL